MKLKIFKKIAPLISICILAVLTLLTESANPQLFKLTTLWDTPDSVAKVSPDGRYVVIQGAENMQYLVEVPSGEIIHEIYGSFHFSPIGRYIEGYTYTNPNEDNQPETILIDLASSDRHILRFFGSVSDYTSDERYLLVTDQRNIYTQVFDLQTDEVVFESANFGSVFSPNDEWVVIGDYSTPNQVTIQVVAFQSNTVLANLVVNNEGEGVSGVYPSFSPNNSLLALRNLRTWRTPVISTETWTVLYETEGTVSFSPDSQYIAANNWEGQSNVQLLDAMTGQILDEVFGSMGFSRDGRYLFRSEAIGYDERHFTVIDTGNQSVVFEHTGYIHVSSVADTDLVKVYDWPESQTEFIDLTTGESIRTVNGDAYYIGDWLIIANVDTGQYQLSDWETSQVLLSSHRPIKFSSNGRYVFVTSDASIDLYSIE